jgi:hypothetical protein
MVLLRMSVMQSAAGHQRWCAASCACAALRGWVTWLYGHHDSHWLVIFSQLCRSGVELLIYVVYLAVVDSQVMAPGR